MPTLAKSAPAVQRASQMLAALKGAGLRLTPQRTAICQVLAGDKSHPTAQALHVRLLKDFPSLSLATIYNTLETLATAGLIHDLGDAGDNTTHYDADPSPHINVICTNCHRIDDYPLSQLAGVAEKVTHDLGYELRGARVAYYGLCPKCQRLLKPGKRL